MITRTAAPPSVLALDSWRDHTVSITFRTVDPVGATELAVAPDPVDDGVLLQLVEAAIVRLVAWRRDFMEAEAEDAVPVPFRLPRYRPDR